MDLFRHIVRKTQIKLFVFIPIGYGFIRFYFSLGFFSFLQKKKQRIEFGLKYVEPQSTTNLGLYTKSARLTTYTILFKSIEWLQLKH